VCEPAIICGVHKLWLTGGGGTLLELTT